MFGGSFIYLIIGKNTSEKTWEPVEGCKCDGVVNSLSRINKNTIVSGMLKGEV